MPDSPTDAAPGLVLLTGATGYVGGRLLRAFVERLPVMICPRWVETKAQPIAIEDLVAYLLGALDLARARGSPWRSAAPTR